MSHFTDDKFQARRDVISDEDRERKLDIQSDGRTVWVNMPSMVARFCPVSQEFEATEKEGPKVIKHADAGPRDSDWLTFCVLVKQRYDVDVKQWHKPMYLGGPS